MLDKMEHAGYVACCHTSAMSAAHYCQATVSVITVVKPPLADSPNKGHLQLSGQHDMHKLNFSIHVQINLPTNDTSY